MSLFRNKRKVFCVGQNKTGTTSLEAVLRNLGYRMGNQPKGELLLHHWARRDFAPIVRLSRSADAFQDLPFSNQFTFMALDQVFSGAKFVLTVRDSADEWYRSLTRFHTKLIGRGRLPTKQDLLEYDYRYKGFLWDVQRLKYGADESTLYDYDIYTGHYEMHNRQVIEYFRHRPDDLLVVNVADSDAIERIYTFLGHEYRGESMPHKNASK